MHKTPIKILLVEDNEGDILLMTEALEECQVPNELIIRRDGFEAIHFLASSANQNPKTLPGLILLDINLPKKNGHEVLENVKNDQNLKHIPIIMLTTSSLESDILRAYQKHANCYLTKPLEVSEFFNITAKIEEFWLTMVRLPKL
ncbi:response regulator [Algoriphagus jejuensis]|uniref:Response regulator n=1 Tax=Algoriphagus jejuensis TaxID=419934 RepID=A0ABP3YI08_9BACT